MTEQQLSEIFAADEADQFALELERKAAELEITVDYYLAEFV